MLSDPLLGEDEQRAANFRSRRARMALAVTIELVQVAFRVAPGCTIFGCTSLFNLVSLFNLIRWL